jgi:hypothetical protein
MNRRLAALGDMKYCAIHPKVLPHPHRVKHYNAFIRVNTED